MNILLVGGSGLVGSFVTPYLKEHHHIRVLDLMPPQHEDVEYVAGSIDDVDALRKALDGVDSFVTMVMKSGQGGSSRDHTAQVAADNYKVNCLGIHLLLHTAQEMGVLNGVHTSTMSVHHRGRRERYLSEDEVPLDGPNVYGLTKGFGELICRYFAREWDFNLAVFRITGPRPRDRYIEDRKTKSVTGDGIIRVTDEEDLAKAYLAGIDYVQTGHGRCDTFFISGDDTHESINMSKARAVLGWQPETQDKLGI